MYFLMSQSLPGQSGRVGCMHTRTLARSHARKHARPDMHSHAPGEKVERTVPVVGATAVMFQYVPSTSTGTLSR